MIDSVRSWTGHNLVMDHQNNAIEVYVVNCPGFHVVSFTELAAVLHDLETASIEVNRFSISLS